MGMKHFRYIPNSRQLCMIRSSATLVAERAQSNSRTLSANFRLVSPVFHPYARWNGQGDTKRNFGGRALLKRALGLFALSYDLFPAKFPERAHGLLKRALGLFCTKLWSLSCEVAGPISLHDAILDNPRTIISNESSIIRSGRLLNR